MRLLELREERELTQSQVALAIKTTRTNIGRWEKGLNEPPASSLILLANFFECSIDYLLGRSDDFGNITIQTKKPVQELNPNEQEIIKNYRSLPREEQEQAAEYIRFLSEKYGKNQKKNA